MHAGFTLPSYAKINWTLRILGKREDGFHSVCTVYQTVTLCDNLSFAEGAEIRLSCDSRHIPTDNRNLCVKAAMALRSRFGVSKGAVIHLEKRIPSPGGLGGGSSNAAATLIGLSRLWELNAAHEDLTDIAEGLGSDVPFFLAGGTAVGTGRGEIIEAVPDLNEPHMLIVTPGVRVSTANAYAGLAAPTLTSEDSNRILRVCRLQADSLDPHHSALINDFEASVFSAYPEIGRVKRALMDLGAVNAAMSGSGASVFAVFDKQETRQAAQKALDHESSWRKFAVATIARADYRHGLHL